MVKGDVVPIVDEHPERDYRRVPPSWHVYTYPRSNMTRFEPAKVDDLGLLGTIAVASVFCYLESITRLVDLV